MADIPSEAMLNLGAVLDTIIRGLPAEEREAIYSRLGEIKVEFYPSDGTVWISAPDSVDAMSPLLKFDGRRIGLHSVGGEMIYVEPERPD